MLRKKPGPWVATLVLLAFLTPSPAHAYNSREHQRLPDVAYQIMNLVRRGEFLVEKARREVPPGQQAQIRSVREVPDGVSADEWNRFLAEVESSPQKLDQLFTSLPDPANSSEACLHKFPILPPSQHLSACRAGELPFAVERYWPGSRETDPIAQLFTACRYRVGYSPGDPIRFPYVFSQVPSNFTGALLGYWAQNVDDGVDDIHMWFRPTNLAYVGTLRDVASKGVELGLTLILAPFACFISLFSGDNCLEEAQRLAREVEPIQLIDSAIPGVGDIDGDDIFDMTGVWHFINIDRAGRSDFNDIPGLKYTDGGYGDGFAGIGRIDAVDYTIIVASDSLGFGVNPDKSLGVQRYTLNDGRFSRRRSDWVSPTLGHVEFEPLDNLALYGWQSFKGNKGASGLGYVLHALGDAVAPHHAIAATGWGHRPYEDQVGHQAVSMFSENVNTAGQLEYARRVLRHAFDWWKFIDTLQAGRTRDVPVRELVSALAFETRQSATWAYKSGISVEYMVDKSHNNYYNEDEMNKAKVLLERGTGATLAFLVKAAQFLQPSQLASPCACPDGQALVDGVCTVCKDAPPQCVDDEPGCRDGQPIDPNARLVELDGQCVTTCPSDKPINQNGICGRATGSNCAPPVPFSFEGTCVAQCPSGAPLVSGGACVANCPPGTVTFGTNFCQPAITPPPPAPCNGPAADDPSACPAACPPETPYLSEGRCVAQCPPGQAPDPANVCRTIIIN